MKNNSIEKVEIAVKSLQKGNGAIILDDESRENEGDLVFACKYLTEKQTAQMIRDCSGIICLVLDEDKAKSLNLKLMTENNQSKNHTNFTVSIEAKNGVTTGVSAHDRLMTIKAASSINSKSSDIVSPGHIFPLIAKNNGVFERAGHTEALYDILKIAQLEEYGVLCELTNKDGSMMKGQEIEKYAEMNNLPVVSVENIRDYRTYYNI